jgi:anion-transporting  ArsA/GET3 family ATPase
MPYRVGGKRGARVISVASRPFYQVADRILGSQFLEDIAEFFVNFQSMYTGFVERAHAVEALLHDRRTTFVVVTTLEAAPLHEAEFFMDQLVRRDFHLGALVLNKTLPDYLLSAPAHDAAERLKRDPGPVAEQLRTENGVALDDPARTARVLATMGDSFLNFEVVARREAELRAELARAPEVTARIPYFEVDIYDLAGLARLGEHLFAPGSSG